MIELCPQKIKIVGRLLSASVPVTKLDAYERRRTGVRTEPTKPTILSNGKEVYVGNIKLLFYVRLVLVLRRKRKTNIRNVFFFSTVFWRHYTNHCGDLEVSEVAPCPFVKVR